MYKSVRFYRGKSLTILACILFLISLQFSVAGENEPASYVNSFIGTGKYLGPSKWGREGGTYPGAVVPWGMIQASPETRFNSSPAGYYFEDDSIYFFSLYNHISGYPNGSAGSLRLMPFNAAGAVSDKISGSYFSHQQEYAEAGYYSVYLPGKGIRTEWTATAHGAFASINFENTKQAGLYLYEAAELEKEGSKSLVGRWGSLFAIIEFNVPFILQSFGNNLFLKFDLSTASGPVLVKFAFSQVSMDGARLNLQAELDHWDFTKTRQQAFTLWNNLLSRVMVQGGPDDGKTIFYTALYHSLLLPYINSDVDGKYRGADGEIRQLQDGHNYSVFSPWDTFRSLHPLLTLLAPSVQAEMIQSLLRIYDERGALPSRPMTGNHSIPIIVDSYFKGLSGFDLEKAYKAMRLRLIDKPYPDMQAYDNLGYVPAEIPESVTRTLEYAYNDWVLAQMAKALGKEDDYQLLLKRSFNYRNCFNPAEMFMHPKNGDGSWALSGGFKEGDKWTYSWFVPHNMNDLLNLMGGSQSFANKLDKAFSEDYYIHDNEPILHYAYLFNYAGESWRSQKWVRKIMQNFYTAQPAGIPGNDDLGSMSSWYVFSAMGFFPTCPGNPQYLLGSPIFDYVKIQQENGKVFEIKADNNSDRNIYIQSAKRNGKSYTKSWINHQDIINGGNLEFEMGSQPSHNFANDSSSIPFSETPGKPDFQISDLKLSSTKATAHQPMTATVKVKNTGSIGTLPLHLFSDNRALQTKNVMLSEDESTDVAMNFRLYQPGDHGIRINNLPEKKVIVLDTVLPGQNSFTLDSLKYNPLIKKGERFKVHFGVKNITSKAQTAAIKIKIDDVVVKTIEQEMEPGQSYTINSEFNVLHPGWHRLIIADSLTHDFKVYAQPTDALLLQLNFDDGSGKFASDKSGFANNANLIGPVKWVDGKEGTAIQTGDSGYAEILLSPSLNSIDDSLTMMLWFYPIDEARSFGRHYRYADIFTQGDHNVIKMQSANTLSFMSGGWGRGQCMADVPQDWNRNWHHLAGVSDGKELKLYIDGILVDRKEIVGKFESSSFPWNIGRNAEITKDRSVNGFVDDVRIYKAALSQEEIRQISSVTE